MATLTAESVKPRLEQHPPVLIAGLRDHFRSNASGEIPDQWRRLAPYLGSIPGQVGRTAYGLVFHSTSGFDYLSGVEVGDTEQLPEAFTSVRIPGQLYAVFSHNEHVSRLSETIENVWQKWLPASGLQPVRPASGAPDFVERYGPGFDPLTGKGDIEVWIPVLNTRN
jgi:AraC family transcriptional regulator